jgi:hypothetical protein
MSIAQNWRLKNQRYALKGAKCETCQNVMFPPREICPHCQEAERKARAVDHLSHFVLEGELRAAR